MGILKKNSHLLHEPENLFLPGFKSEKVRSRLSLSMYVKRRRDKTGGKRNIYFEHKRKKKGASLKLSMSTLGLELSEGQL